MKYDKYAERWFKVLADAMKNNNKAESIAAINKIYEDGFEDGLNEQH